MAHGVPGYRGAKLVHYEQSEAYRSSRRGDDRRFGEDGDASLPFHRVGVEKRVAMVDTAEFAYVARGIQQRFRQRGFAGVNMRQNAGDDSFHGLLPLPRATAEAAAAYQYAKALTSIDVRAWW